jgi:hypothetical protein
MRKFALVAAVVFASSGLAVAGPLARLRERREARVETRHHEPVTVVVDKSGKPALLLRDGTLAPVTSKDGKLTATAPAKEEKGVKVIQRGSLPAIQLKKN